ncbi:hypothetical protein [Sphingobacterium chungjuense]|uniref:hypothetical protein n=1 Tax=Sphingobacterium chungjuense TaxID=2675553 RepID=UPI00140A88B5|nr:hypothetical protein [Sphingobacterium chungjuense]
MGVLTSDKKVELIQWLSTLEDQEIIEKLMKFKEQETKDWWDVISSEEQLSVEKGISDADSGNVKPHATARRLYEKWL